MEARTRKAATKKSQDGSGSRSTYHSYLRFGLACSRDPALERENRGSGFVDVGIHWVPFDDMVYTGWSRFSDRGWVMELLKWSFVFQELGFEKG